MGHKLLQINGACNVSSTGKIAEDIGNLAQEAGYESYITYALKAVRPSKNKTIKIHNDWSFWFDVAERMLLDNKGLCMVSSYTTKRLIEDIERIDPDVIHLHTLHYHEINCALLWAYLAKRAKPVVYTLHDCWPLTGNCTHPVYFNCEKWRSHCELCPMPHSYKNSLFIDRSSRNYDIKKKLLLSIPNLSIITVSKWMENNAKNSFLKVRNIQTIYNGINTSKFKMSSLDSVKSLRKKYGIHTKFMMLGVATSWSSRKGLDDYKLLSKTLNDDEVIVLLGLTDKQIADLPGNIIGLKRTTDFQEMADLYTAADAVMNLSYAETFGLTTAEGFACGTPCIGYDCTATPELINEQTGILVTQGNIKGLREAVSQIKEKPKDFYSDSCRKYALTHFDKNKNFIKYIQLYNNLLQ